MATRFYFATGAAAAISPAVDAAWERQIAAFTRYYAPTTKQNSALADVVALFGSTTTSQTLYHQWVSDALDAQSIAGTVSMVIRGLEGAATEDVHLAFSLRVITPALAVRGTLLLYHATSTEMPTVTPATVIHSARALTTVVAVAGDRLCMEIGLHGVTSANVLENTLRFGDPSGTADFALTAGLTTDLVPWWETSQTILFQPSTLTAELREGGTVRATRTWTPDANRFTITLDAGEKASIVNWPDVELWATATAGVRAVRVTRIKGEAPVTEILPRPIRTRLQALGRARLW